jgi:hypothetical protein
MSGIFDLRKRIASGAVLCLARQILLLVFCSVASDMVAGVIRWTLLKIVDRQHF